MKTGRLLKFQRPGGEVHAYLYSDQGSAKAALYVQGSGQESGTEPVHSVSAPTAAAVEKAVRDWVDLNFPRSR